MIVGLGMDVIEIDRIETSLARHGDALLDRLLTDRERAFAATRRGHGLAAHVAGRFAAKEAALKALATGLAVGMRWHDVEVVANRLHAAPAIEMHGAAAARLRELGVDHIHVSITHGERTAAAVVVLERRG